MKTNKIISTIALGCLVAIVSSCNLTKKAVDTITCDETITYAQTIKGILDAKCTGCHSGPKPAYGIDLSTYEEAAKVVPHRLSCVINWSDNCNRMPPSGGQLTSTEIQQIQCWLDNGVKN
jgi:uncharacterized membrane protein